MRRGQLRPHVAAYCGGICRLRGHRFAARPRGRGERPRRRGAHAALPPGLTPQQGTRSGRTDCHGGTAAAGSRSEPSAFGSRHDGADRGRAKPSPRDGRRADRLRAAARLREQLRRQCPAHSLPPRRRYRKGDRRQGAFYRQLRRTMGLGEAAAGGPRGAGGAPGGTDALLCDGGTAASQWADRPRREELYRSACVRPRHGGRSQMGGRPAFG